MLNSIALPVSPHPPPRQRGRKKRHVAFGFIGVRTRTQMKKNRASRQKAHWKFVLFFFCFLRPFLFVERARSFFCCSRTSAAAQKAATANHGLDVDVNETTLDGKRGDADDGRCVLVIVRGAHDPIALGDIGRERVGNVDQ
nr:hypothetical protein [Pandoravirus massiliensis]